MPTQAAILLVLALAVAIVAGGVFLIRHYRQARSQRLRQKFGPEYERTVQAEVSRLRAERILAKRERRMRRFQIRRLVRAQCQRFRQSWREVQARFVDDPKTAVGDADRLVQQVMSARGYAVEDFEQCAADISVNHPAVVENYRAGHAIALQYGRGQATTEDLRRAVIHYRALFNDLIEEAPEQEEASREVARAS